MADVTVLYYSSNREHEAFESATRAIWMRHAHARGLPIVSVTQQPVDVGTNIVVGDVGASGFNMFRQVLIGLEAITTPFVLSAEADCLYPPDYFAYVPTAHDRCFRNQNLYVLPRHRSYFFRKPGGATHAQIVGRDYYLNRLRFLFTGAPQWSVEEKSFPKERTRHADVFPRDAIVLYDTLAPVIQIKTRESMRSYTASERIPIPQLPHWGTGRDIRRTYGTL